MQESLILNAKNLIHVILAQARIYHTSVPAEFAPLCKGRLQQLLKRLLQPREHAPRRRDRLFNDAIIVLG